MRLSALLFPFLLASCSAASAAGVQSDPVERFSFRNSFSLGGEWSNTSSHIFLGVVRGRRMGAFDLTLSHRLLDRRAFSWYNDVEVQPLFFLEDPMQHVHDTFTRHYGHFPMDVYDNRVPVSRCRPSAYSYTNPQRSYTFTQTVSCGTRWTYAGGISPLGQRVHFLPRRRLQPYVLVNPGFVASARDIPLPKTSSLNFTFDVGVGLACFGSVRRSVSVDYRFHHLSNAYLGADPGVDSQVVHVTYTFGR